MTVIDSLQLRTRNYYHPQATRFMSGGLMPFGGEPNLQGSDFKSSAPGAGISILLLAAEKCAGVRLGNLNRK